MKFLFAKGPLERSGHRWKDSIKMDLKEIGFEVVDWLQMTQDSKYLILMNL
jgi:hypothetical protein